MISSEFARRSTAGALLIASMAAASCGTSDKSPERTFPAIGEADALPEISGRVGMAQQFVWGDDPESKARRGEQIAFLTSLGVRNERIDFTWHKLENRPGEWDFSKLDPVVNDAAAAGISLLAVACYGNPIYPSRAGEPTGAVTNLPLDNPAEVNYPPTDPAHYANYVAKIAERYKDHVKRYELWNEQNLGYRFWRPEASGAEYARLAAAAGKAGKEACADCTFVVGGLSMPQPVPRLNLYKIGPLFLEDMYAEVPNLNEFVQAIGFHTYPMPKDPPEFETAAFPERFQGSQTTQTAQMRDVVARHGQDTPVWITETGWPTNPGIPSTDEDVARIFGLDPKIIQFGRALLGDEDYATLLETIRGVPEDFQARYLVRSVLLAAIDRVPVIVLYGLQDYPIEPEINQESAFGVFRNDGTEKPGAQALRTLLKRFGSYRFVEDVRDKMRLSDAYRALTLRDGERTVLALWRWKDGSERLRLTSLPRAATVVDQFGREIAQAPAGGGVDLDVGPDVTYVEIQP